MRPDANILQVLSNHSDALFYDFYLQIVLQRERDLLAKEFHYNHMRMITNNNHFVIIDHSGSMTSPLRRR